MKNKKKLFFHTKQMILQIMTARLADIVSWSRSGRIAASGLPRAAVRGLIAALFEESAARDEALAAVGGGGGGVGGGGGGGRG